MNRADKYRAAPATSQGRSSNVIRFPEQLVENLRRLRSPLRPQKAPRFRLARGPNMWSSVEEWQRFTLRQWLSQRAMAGID